MTSLALARDIALSILRASVQGGARPGDIIGPAFLSTVHLPGLMADSETGWNYAAEQEWVERLPGNQIRLADAGSRTLRIKLLRPNPTRSSSRASDRRVAPIWTRRSRSPRRQAATSRSPGFCAF